MTKSQIAFRRRRTSDRGSRPATRRHDNQPGATTNRSSISGELAVNTLDGTTDVRLVLDLKTTDHPGGRIVIGAIDVPGLRSWRDLPDLVVTDELVDIADGDTMSRAGGGEVTLDGQTGLSAVRRLTFSPVSHPGRVEIRLELVDRTGQQDALTVTGVVDIGAIRVRNKDYDRADGVLDLAAFRVTHDAHGHHLHQPAADS